MPQERFEGRCAGMHDAARQVVSEAERSRHFQPPHSHARAPATTHATTSARWVCIRLTNAAAVIQCWIVASAQTRVAVTGATGYIGTRLVPRLADAGYAVRCLVRSPRKLDDRPWRRRAGIEVLRTDLDEADTLASQLAGCDAAYYLVHSMEAAGADYAARDRRLAETFRDAAARAGVQRIVYLGGLGQPDERLSAHLQSRRDVEHVLTEGPVPVTAFRAAMIIGSGSASFEILRYLAERLPVLLTPRWVRTESQPIAVRDVLFYLVQCLAVPETAGRVLEIGGADVATYERLLQVMAEERKLPRRVIVPVPVLTPFLSSLWIHLVTPVSARLARPLAEGLRNRVVVEDHTAERLMPRPRLGAREAIRLALDAEARADVESTWSSAGPVPGDPDWAGGTVFEDARTIVIPAAPVRVFQVLAQLGGRRGWLAHDRLWKLRGIMDRLVGGPGWRRTRRSPTQLSWGDAVGFWRVAELVPAERLTLRAEMKVPGDAVLDFELSPAPSDGGASSTRLVQTARFRPRGLAGLLYWYAVLPFHGPVFKGLLQGIRDAAVQPDAPSA